MARLKDAKAAMACVRLQKQGEKGWYGRLRIYNCDCVAVLYGAHHSVCVVVWNTRAVLLWIVSRLLVLTSLPLFVHCASYKRRNIVLS